MISVRRAVEVRAFSQSRAASRDVTLGLKTWGNSSSGHFSAVGGNAPTRASDGIALDGLESSVIGPASRDEKSVGRHAILPGFVFHDHLRVLAGRLDERLDALGSATVGTAFQLAVAVLVS